MRGFQTPAWFAGDQVILYRPEGIVTEDHLTAANTRIIALLQQSKADQVHIIWDTSRATNSLISLNAVSQNLSYLQHPTCGMNAVCCVTRPLTGVAWMVGMMMQSVKPDDTHVFTTTEDALLYFAAVDPTLRPLLLDNPAV